MRNLVFLSVAAAASLSAQGPPFGGPPARVGGVPAARLLLSHTGELELTDAQVVRLAAIERRAEARRRAMRARTDSVRARTETQRADSAARRQFRERLRADLERAREQARTDQRDAIAVLTPDQQGRAWELVTRPRGPGRRDGVRGAREMRGMRGMRSPSGRKEMWGMRNSPR